MEAELEELLRKVKEGLAMVEADLVAQNPVTRKARRALRAITSARRTVSGISVVRGELRVPPCARRLLRLPRNRARSSHRVVRAASSPAKAAADPDGEPDSRRTSRSSMGGVA
jgi:hypothetical protein